VDDKRKKLAELLGGPPAVKNPELRALIEERMKTGGEANSKREKLRELLSSGTMAAMDTGKVEMRKAPGAKKAEEALSTAAEFIPFVGAGKAAAEGDYGSAALQAGMDVAGGPLLKGAAALGGKFLAPALMGAIKAYHGSPHKFDKFDISKIGTGEGAQAYGHGLYFAENPKVAESYKNAGIGNIDWENAKYGNKKIQTLYDEATRKQDAAHRAKDQNAINRANAELYYWESLLTGTHPYVVKANALDPDNGWPELKNFVDKIDDKKFKNIDYPETGLYEVNLRWPDAAREAADPLSPHHFLDYDKPLSEQSDYVKSMLSVDKRAKDKLYGSGAEYYRGLTGRYAQDAPIHFSAEQAEEKFGMPLASQQLKALGIPGIRYKDAASRGTEGGTSNYVLFSDELADILKRNDEQLKAIGGKKFEYPEAKSSVSGLRVGEQIKNTSSIPATFSNYKIDKGIRSVPMSAFETTNPQDLFYAKNDLERVNNLAEQIKNNGYIDPLIVAVDESGPYVLEGAHRLGALHTLGVEDIPAMVVRDLGD